MRPATTFFTRIHQLLPTFSSSAPPGQRSARSAAVIEPLERRLMLSGDLAELAWGRYLGGDTSDRANAVAVDDAGYIYITGETRSDGWVSGGWDESLNAISNRSDAFAVKLTPTGEHVWSTFIGGTNWDFGLGIAVDSSGNVYVTGETESLGWVSGGEVTTFPGTASNGFLVKLDSDGQHVWSTYFGVAEGRDKGVSVAIDSADNVVVAGATNLPVSDVIVARYQADGALIWSDTFGGAGRDEATDLALDSSDNLLISGVTVSSGWVSGGVDETFNGEIDGFVLKLNLQGDHLWSTYLGGDDLNDALGIAVDDQDDVLVTGSTGAEPWNGGDIAFMNSFNGDLDAFVVKLSGDGGANGLIWARYLGGDDPDVGLGIAATPGGRIVVAGATLSDGWTADGFDTTHNAPGTGFNDGFVAQLDADGNEIWSTYLGGSDEDSVNRAAVDGAGNIFAAGRARSDDWADDDFLNDYTDQDGFVVRITPTDLTEALPGTIGDNAGESDIAFDSTGAAHLVWHDTVNRDLRYATRSAAGIWSGVTIIDNREWAGQYLSVAVDADDRPAVAYFDGDRGALRYARFDGAAWNLQGIEENQSVGLYPSLVFDAQGRPAVSYFQKSRGELRVATEIEPGTWSIDTVDGWLDVGRHTSMALSSAGQLAVAYENTTLGQLKIARQTGNGWATGFIDRNTRDVTDVSLAFDQDDVMTVSYRDHRPGHLKFARFRGDGLGWDREFVADGPDNGIASQLVYDSAGTARIFWHHAGYDLLYSLTGSIGDWSLDLLANGGDRLSAGIDPADDDVLLAWFDPDEATLKFREA